MKDKVYWLSAAAMQELRKVIQPIRIALAAAQDMDPDDPLTKELTLAHLHASRASQRAWVLYRKAENRFRDDYLEDPE